MHRAQVCGYHHSQHTLRVPRAQSPALAARHVRRRTLAPSSTCTETLPRGLTQHRSSVQLGRRAPLWQHVAPSNDVSLFCSPPHTHPPHEVHLGSPQPGVTPPGRMRHPVPQIQTSNESNCLRTDEAHGKRALRCDCAGCSEGPRPWLPATPIANLVATPTGCVQSSTGNMHTTQKQKVVVPGSGHTRKQICIALACTHNLHTSVAAAPGATSCYPLWLRPGQLLPVARVPLRQPGSSGSPRSLRGRPSLLEPADPGAG